MIHRATVLAAIALACGACGTESTSFRPTDRTDPHRVGPPSTTYDVRIAGQALADAHVWSSGGYVSSSDEPMTHVGFELRNHSSSTLLFDGDALELVAFDSDGKRLPPARFTALTPLGPSLISVAPGAIAVLAAYFVLPVEPRAVGSMQVRWTVRAGDGEYREITGFVRDDDAPSAAPARPTDDAPPVKAPLPTQRDVPRS